MKEVIQDVWRKTPRFLGPSTGRMESSSTEMEQRLQVKQVWGEGKEFRGGHVAFDMLKCLLRSTGRSPEGGNGHPLQYSCLGSAMNRGVWGATVHGLQRVRHNSTHTHVKVGNLKYVSGVWERSLNWICAFGNGQYVDNI